MFVSPPHPNELLDPPPEYLYEVFPSKLDESLFPRKEPPAGIERGEITDVPVADDKTFIARRSKSEVKAALKVILCLL